MKGTIHKWSNIAWIISCITQTALLRLLCNQVCSWMLSIQSRYATLWWWINDGYLSSGYKRLFVYLDQNLSKQDMHTWNSIIMLYIMHKVSKQILVNHFNRNTTTRGLWGLGMVLCLDAWSKKELFRYCHQVRILEDWLDEIKIKMSIVMNKMTPTIQAINICST